jgi:hypothetical protein
VSRFYAAVWTAGKLQTNFINFSTIKLC